MHMSELPAEDNFSVHFVDGARFGSSLVVYK
jgi:hypothetical protein